MLSELRVLFRRSFRHPDESIKRGLIYTSVCDHSGTATANGVARSELTPPCSNTRACKCVHTCATYTTHSTHTHTNTHRALTAYEVFGGREIREGGRSYKKKPKCLSACLIWTLSTCSSLRSECRDLGAIDASAGSINVLFCLFVCPQSPGKPWGENADRRLERLRCSSMMMRRKHQ